MSKDYVPFFDTKPSVKIDLMSKKFNKYISKSE